MTYDAYFAAVARADAARAVEAVDDAVARGESVRSLVRDVVARGQADAGRLWFEGRWTVADEHAATAVAEQALTVLAPPRAPSPGAARVVLACAEGEWHTFPARLAATLARTPALDVLVVGGSVPADHLARHLRATRPAALALSCTLPTNLIGAARSIAAAHAEGVPVVVGGAAWGRGQRRADRLGADLRLDDPGRLADAVATLDPNAVADPCEVPVEALLLDAPPHEVLLLALERQCAANPWLRTMTPYQRHRTLEDLGWLARHAAAALACDDPTILRDLIEWLLALLSPRGVPAAAVIDSCYFLADAVEPESPHGADLLRGEADGAHRRLLVPEQSAPEPDRSRTRD
ncbi:MAG TPA: B12-binding domain-containing protein [Mycobacteriales bacterium]|jgi:methanogenic corrinoid protein MtbC1|nr:B12-binding domain-containing protein [Mycobacteriales bacterium]